MQLFPNFSLPFSFFLFSVTLLAQFIDIYTNINHGGIIQATHHVFIPFSPHVTIFVGVNHAFVTQYDLHV